MSHKESGSCLLARAVPCFRKPLTSGVISRIAVTSVDLPRRRCKSKRGSRHCTGIPAGDHKLPCLTSHNLLPVVICWQVFGRAQHRFKIVKVLGQHLLHPVSLFWSACAPYSSKPLLWCVEFDSARGAPLSDVGRIILLFRMSLLKESMCNFCHVEVLSGIP